MRRNGLDFALRETILCDMMVQRWWQAHTSRPFGVDVAAVLMLLIGFAAFVLVADVLPAATGWQLGIGLAAAATGIAALAAFVPTADQRGFPLGFGVSIAAVGIAALTAVLVAPLDVSQLLVAGLAATALLWTNRRAFHE